MKLEGKVAVVTGAASGMGKAIALLFAKQGAQVIISDINEEASQTAVAEVEKAGGKAVSISANVAKPEDIKQLIKKTVETYGTIDILVNNAGIMDNFEPAGEVEDDNWERIFAVNSTSVMRATREVLPIFLEKEQGNIINIASAGGVQGARAGAAYTASKHAVAGFTKNTGFMYAKHGIRCNAIAPGAVETNISSSMTSISEFGMGKIQPGLELNPRIGKAEEIASLALFLASSDASFVNGTVIAADGGWIAY